MHQHTNRRTHAPSGAETNRKRTDTARMWIGFCAIGFCAAMVIVGLLWLGQREGKSVTVATVNGISVDVREFLMIMEEERSDILSTFTERYGVSADDAFWQQEFDGQTPAQALIQQTLHRITFIKVQQQWMKDKKILEDCGYSAFLEEWKQENIRRENAVAQGEAVYGSAQYTSKQYYTVRMDKGIVQLKETLSQSELAVTDAEIQTYYTQRTEPLLFESDGTKRELPAVQELIKQRIVDEKYSALIEKQAAEATVCTIEKNMNKIQIH